MSDTIEVDEPDVKKEAPPVPTRTEMRDKGWSAKELDAGEKHGLLVKSESAEQAKIEADKKAADEKAKADAEAKAKEIEAGKKPDTPALDKPKSDIPDFTFKTPEQEKVFLDAFGSGTPQRAMYFRMKNERLARQAAERERDRERAEKVALEAQIKALSATKPALEMDEDGNPIDPEDKPLTVKQLRELQRAEAEAIEKKNRELNERAQVVADAQRTQEEYARSLFEDFDPTVEKAKDLMKNLDTLVPEKWKQAKVIKLIRELQVAAANADKIDLDEYHAALIAYELGQLHPTYGQKPNSPNGNASDKDGKLDPKKDHGSLTPEQMKRIEENARRGASSASVTGGGGKRTISVDDVDLATLNRMGYSERQKFRQKYPDQYAKLLRG